ncbi:MAG: M56 family metallopeptidase [Litorimonas sp.]
MGAEFTHVLDSLGWAVLHSIWQGGLAFLFVIVWRAALRGRSPALRHAGQIMALIGCMAAFVWTFAVYLGLPNIATESGATLSAANANEAPRLFTGLIAPFDPAAAQASLGLSRITPILACLWALGFAAMSLRYAFAFGQVQQLRTLGIQNPNAAWTERFKQLAQDIGVSDKVRLFVSANVSGPMTLGLIKPVVLVPMGFLTGLPADQVEAILRHELAHIRRYDYALNLIQAGVKTVLFYHPAIHIICRWADQDREQACDDLAVKEGRDPLTLARGLAALRIGAHPTFGMAATGTGEDMPLMDRLTRLAGQTPKRGRPEHILMSVLSALLLGSVYLGTSSRAEAHPVPPTVPDTVILLESEPPVEPVPPAPPAPPALMKMDLSKLQNGDDMQRFIDKDKASYKAFAKEMDRYEDELQTFFEAYNLSEDEREDYSEFYEDLADDISDIFEDRREAIEDLYEEQIERKQEELEWKQEMKEAEIEWRAEMKGLEGAIKGIEAAERETRSMPDSDAKKAKLKALKQARKDIAKAQKDMSMARSQAATAASVARSEANQKQARKLQAEARKQQDEARKQQVEARRQAELARKNAEYAAKKYKKAHIEIDRGSQNRHEEFRDKVMIELLKDGLIRNSKETVSLSHPNGTMILNGEPLPKRLRGKYCDLWDKYGFMDGKSQVEIAPDSLTILTDWKNGQHTTRVTYGTFDTEKTSH